jgi:2-succinyl-5-enolpyruvyl-6-hydroxy-3-cyclohexene-1-carboxylate synthase
LGGGGVDLSAPNPSTALGQVVIDELARNRIAGVVIAPGSRSAALAIAAAQRSDLMVVVAIDERSAAFHALGMAKASGRPAVVITTSGTAAANVYPAVIEAEASATPLVILTADRPPELRHAASNQTIDQIKLFGDRVRWFCELGVAEARADSVAYWRSVVCRAVAEAMGWKAAGGPVHLNLAFREPLVPISDDGRVAAEPFPYPLDGRADGQPWTKVSSNTEGKEEKVSLSGKGMMVVGETGIDRGALHRLATDLGWPLIAEAHSGARRGRVITTFHHLFSVPEVAELLQPECVLRVGRVGLSPRLAPLLVSPAEQVVLDPHGLWADPDRSARRMARSVSSLLVEEPAPGNWIELWHRYEDRARQALDRALDRTEAPNEPRLARDTARAVPEGGTLVVGSSMPVRDLDWFMPSRSIEVLSNRGASGIDGYVSTVLGSANSRWPVVGLTGDLSLLHDQNGFLIDRRPEAVLVVANNDGGGVFHFLPQAGFPDWFDRLFGTPHGRDLSRLAQLYDLGHRLVEKAADVGPAIGEALAEGGLQLVEVPTDRHTNIDLHRRITEEVAAALRHQEPTSSPGA